MCEWVYKRHMTDFEMNVHRERAALAQKIIFYANGKSVAFGTSRRISPRGSTGKGSTCRKSLESRSALCRLICGNRRKHSFLLMSQEQYKKQTKNSMIKK